MSEVLLIHQELGASRAKIKQKLTLQYIWKGTHGNAFKILINVASKERGDEARPVILAELQQMIDKKVCHAVRTFDLTALDRAQDNYPFLYDFKGKEHGLQDLRQSKIKVRLVAGGDQQDKESHNIF
jgi:hypothetical protein